jgi:hypothetical protein
VRSGFDGRTPTIPFAGTIDVCPELPRLVWPTPGVECEFALVGKRSHDYVNAASELLKLMGQRHGSGSVAAQRAASHHRRADPRDLRDRRRGHDGLDVTIAKVRPLANELGVELDSAGAHPFAVWSHQQLTEGHRCEELMPAPQWCGREDQCVTPSLAGGGSSVAAMIAASSTALGRPGRALRPPTRPAHGQRTDRAT